METFAHFSMLIKIADNLPCGFGCIDEADQVDVVGGDCTELGECVEIDDLAPEGFAEKDQRQAGHAAGLDQGQAFEKFVERAETAGKNGDGLGTQHEMHLPDRKVVKIEAQLRGNIGVRGLLVRQDDVEADRRRPLLRSATVSRFHDPGPPPVTTTYS